MFETLEDTEARLDLRHNMRQLTRGQFVAIRLYLVGYTHAEIGAALGVTRRAIGRRIERARATLASSE